MELLKDFLLDINKKIAIPGIEALAGSSGLAEIEIDDETMKRATAKFNGLMTIDAAQNNAELSEHFKKKLHPTIKGELFGNMDTDIISSVKSLFGDDAVTQLKEKESTFDKMKYFGELTKKAIEAKGSGEENEKIKELNTNLNKQIQDLNGSAEKKQKDFDKLLKKTEQEFNTVLIEKEFNAAFGSYNLGDKYNEDLFKNALRAETRDKVKAVAKLTLSEDKTQIVPKNPTDGGLDLFIDGNPIKSLKDILDPIMKGHIKVNNVDQKKKDGEYVPVEKVKLSTQVQHLQQRKKETFSF